MSIFEVNSIFQNPVRLHRDLLNDPTVGWEFISLDSKGGKTYLNFENTLSTLDRTYLNDEFFPGFIDEDNLFDITTKIVALMASERSGVCFKEINYKTGLITSLFPKRTTVKGEVQKVQWYEDQALTNKVLEVDINYTRDAFGFATSRTTTRKWVNNDGSFNPKEKSTTKDYTANSLDQIKEGKKRRGNIVDGIQIPAMGLMMQALMPPPYNMTQVQVLLTGREFLDRYNNQFKMFIDSSSSQTDIAEPDFGKKHVVIKFEDTDDVVGFNAGHNYWLDIALAPLGGATMRQYLIGEFSI